MLWENVAYLVDDERRRAAFTALKQKVGLDAWIERSCAARQRAFHLLRAHGQALCKSAAPRCDACPLAKECPSPR